MPTTKTQPPPTDAILSTLVEPETREFWESVGIFPDSLDQSGKRNDLTRRARRTLHDLGVGNLRLLCEQAAVLRDHDADEIHLVDALLAASPSDTLLHIREFMHRRVGAVEETFQTSVLSYKFVYKHLPPSEG